MLNKTRSVLTSNYSHFMASTVRSLTRILKRDLFVVAWYLLLSAFAVFPILSDPRNLILGGLADNVHYVYMAGWSAQSLLMGDSPFIDPRLNYPDDLALSSNDSPYLSFIIVAPFSWILGPIFGYNATIFLSHFLSGYFTYLWSKKLTSNSIAATFAGTAFMLTPFRLFKSLGHANMVSTQMIPLFFWSLDNCIRQRKPKEWAFWILGAATFLVASSSQYILVICLVTGALYTLFSLLPKIKLVIVHGWRIAISVLFGTLVGSLPYISILGSGGFEPYNVGRTRVWSADPINFILPSSMHPLWGDIVNNIRPESYAVEKTLYVSLVALAIAIFGVVYALKYKIESRLLFIWTLTALSAAIFALGTDLWINNKPINESNPVWLPSYYLAKLPLINIMRVWSRFGIVTIFFVAMIAGYGTKYIIERTREQWFKKPVSVVLILLLIIDLLPGSLPYSSLKARAIDRWLAQQDGDFAVAFLPVDKPLTNDIAIFGSLFHGKQMPAYIHAAHQPRAYKDFAAMAIEFPSESSINYMKWRNLKFIILDKDQYNGWRAAKWSDVEEKLRKFPDVKRIAEIENYVVFSLN